MTESIESSLAFLQIQKSQSNLKRVRAGARNDDVFRIFRRTGQRIALIAQQIERERCTYLKNSYTEKNQLCKEFATILRSNKESGLRQSASESRECPSDRDERRERRKKAAIRKINVNVFKRCECCRRLALRVQGSTEEGDGIRGVDGGEEEHDCTGHAENDKSEAIQEGGTLEDKEKHEALKMEEKPLTNPINSNSKQGQVETPRVQFCCPPVQNIQTPESPIGSPSGKAVLENGQYELRRATASSLGTISLGSTSMVPAGSTGSPRRGQGARSTPVRRAVHSPWLKHSASPAPLEPMAKVKLAGQAWQEHVQSLQSRKSAREGTPAVTLPDAYEAFRKLVRAMEARDREKQQEYLREMEYEEESEWTSGRARRTASPAHSASWQPLKRSSVTHDATFSEVNFLRVGSTADRILYNWNEERASGNEHEDKGHLLNAPDGIFLTESC